MAAKKLHILVADDDPDIRRIIGGQLANEGHEIIYSKDGNEAREMARRFLPDIILLDLHMPVMDGMEAAQRLKSEAPTKHIPIILLTNDDLSYDSEQKVQEVGIDDYVHKSEGKEVIHEHIKKILEKTP